MIVLVYSSVKSMLEYMRILLVVVMVISVSTFVALFDVLVVSGDDGSLASGG